MVSLFVDERGQQHAQTILFLHASGSSSKMWRHHAAALEDSFHCLAVDLPGHGKSRQIEWTNLEAVTEMIADLIQEKAHGKPHLVGLSLGGSLILNLLAQYADLFDRALVDGVSHQPIKGYRKIIAGVYVLSLLKNTSLIAGMMGRLMAKDGVPKDDYQTFVADLQQASSRSFRRAMSQANLLRLDPLRFANPVFFVSGGKEAQGIQESHRVLVQNNPQSRSAYYPDKGHAWLFSDAATHIQLIRYFFQDGSFPERLEPQSAIFKG